MHKIKSVVSELTKCPKIVILAVCARRGCMMWYVYKLY